MPGIALHVLKIRPVIESRSDESRPHRMRGIPSFDPDAAGKLLQNSINRIWCHVPTTRLIGGVSSNRLKHRTIQIIAVAERSQVITDPLGDFGMNGDRIAFVSFSGHPEGIPSAIRV